MPGTTPKLALRYPLATEAPDGPGAILQLATDTDNALATDGTFSYPGTITEYASGAQQFTMLRRTGKVVHLTLNVNVGANGLGVGGIILLAQAGYRPPTNVRTSMDAFTGGAYAGTRFIAEMAPDGNLRAVYLSAAIPAGSGLFGQMSWPIP